MTGPKENLSGSGGVAGEDHRNAGVGLLPEQRAHHVDGHRCEPREGLVENQHGEGVEQRRGQLDPLPVAVAEVLKLLAAAAAQAARLAPGCLHACYHE